jgi:hypothetical protein
MGGFGSGRNSGRATTGTALPLTVRAIRRYNGVLRWSRRGEPVGSIGFQLSDTGPSGRTVTLAWTRNGRESVTQTLRLVAVPMRFGGVRWWWSCPRCETRRAALYNPSGRGGWACRTCYRLAHPVQNESPTDRAFRRWERAAARLGVEDLVPADALDMAPEAWTPPRPKGMRRHTYSRLVAGWESSLAATARGLGAQLENLLSRSGYTR